MKQNDVARRRFLQGSAAVAAGASLGVLGPWADALAAAANMKVLSRDEVATILVVAQIDQRETFEIETVGDLQAERPVVEIDGTIQVPHPDHGVNGFGHCGAPCPLR